jgi:hypothetical protein
LKLRGDSGFLRARLGAASFVVGLAFGLDLGGVLLDQRVQHGQQEGRGLAAAGLAGDHQVVDRLAFGVHRHGTADALLLHVGRLGEAEVGHGGQEFRGEAERGKAVGHGGHGGFLGFRHEMSTRRPGRVRRH